MVAVGVTKNVSGARYVKQLKVLDAKTSQIGAVAAHALDEIHSAIFGQAPNASRAWTDGDAILLVVRMPATPDADTQRTPVSVIQRMVSATVYRRTGVMLRNAGTNVDAERGLAVLAFERTATPQDPQPFQPAGSTLVRDTD